MKGEFFGIRVISAPGCISQPAGSGCSVIDGASDQGINGGIGAATQPVGAPTLANDDPDATIAIDATEQASGGNQSAFGGVSLRGTQTEQVISTQGAEDAHATASCEAGLASACSGSFVISVCVTTQHKAQAPSKASSSCDQYLRDLATAAGTKPAYHLLALGNASFKLASGTKKTIAIPLTKTAKRLLAKWHTLRTVVVATAREGKTTKISSRDVTLKLKH